MGAIARMAEAAGVPPTRLMRDFAGLSLGPGRVSLSDYDDLRLYDEAFWAGADRRAVVGRRRGLELCRQANFRREFFGLAANRLASCAYLAAHGLPVAQVEAIYREGLATPADHVLRSRDELRRFLQETAGRPLFGRPVEGGDARPIVAKTAAQVDRIVEDLGETPSRGYLFQPRIAPHPQVAGFAGGALAAVRLLTLASDTGPRVFRALWKLPDRLAELDLRTGQVVRVGARPGADPPAGRARSEAASALLRARIPDWEALKAAAVEAARLVGELALVGWDVGPSKEGPIILGFTPTPDLAAHQIVERRGLLDAEFLAFLEAQRRLAAEEARFEADCG
ncbi:MAG: hypothetical protein JO127_06255 [Caulobacteraceae bacterium]|nr:hypothetical protein [Caulobacteraceae bacterium]